MRRPEAHGSRRSSGSIPTYSTKYRTLSASLMAWAPACLLWDFRSLRRHHFVPVLSCPVLSCPVLSCPQVCRLPAVPSFTASRIPCPRVPRPARHHGTDKAPLALAQRVNYHSTQSKLQLQVPTRQPVRMVAMSGLLAEATLHRNKYWRLSFCTGTIRNHPPTLLKVIASSSTLIGQPAYDRCCRRIPGRLSPRRITNLKL
ncbi:hypothetical protein B0T16DRAFT_74784 [Cercophora newfieldiana]|uniref:Uncharacterized protein n=1 Tax=Cercophora newfieldiana TaxID=92897 RepID=A0AA39YHQ9_9PEZI|nr:hypothetical protein B0T16DRAFT_74784 [Cercophora newfieldiana]